MNNTRLPWSVLEDTSSLILTKAIPKPEERSKYEAIIIVLPAAPNLLALIEKPTRRIDS
jgi:hypothetical protein